MSDLIDISGITTQEVYEKNALIATPPDVDLVIQNVELDSGATDGVIEVQGISPANTATTYAYDIDGADTWGNTTGLFTGLATGAHTVQGRDTVTTANVSVVLTLTV